MGLEEHLFVTANHRDIERVGHPHLAIVQRVPGQPKPLDAPITLVKLSRAGFLMRTTRDFPIGEIHEFWFSVGQKGPIVLQARILHSHRVSSAGGSSHLVSLEFVSHHTAAGAQAIESLFGITFSL